MSMDAPIIAVRDVTKHYGPSVGIEGLDLDVGAGEVLGFLGPNGAGKTTTIRLLVGLIRPTRGRVAVFGAPPRLIATRRRIGYLPGDLALDPRLSAEALNRPPTTPKKKLDAVLITHGHLDHTGRLPLLAKRGHRLPVFATPAKKNGW